MCNIILVSDKKAERGGGFSAQFSGIFIFSILLDERLAGIRQESSEWKEQ